ncbi:hypothetical protein [Jeotgalibaca porci]|uniref:hypothetical protein n=1 Tax=Jeotgalibaca porci TaxID=1868793 RepID=UPI00359FE25B
MKVIATRRIKADFDIQNYLSSKGYQINREFVLHDPNINGWEVWTLHVPKPPLVYENYAIGMKGNKFVLIDPGEAVFNRKWIGELLK